MVTSPHQPSPPESPLISGTYLLGELLGTGGSASVFVATDAVAEVTVALKVLHPHLAVDAENRNAFFREARIAEPLDHPNLVGVRAHGVDDSDGAPLAWIALEHVEGLSLGEWIDTFGALPVDQALAVAEGVLGALDAMHTAGLVHRDISPSNVVVAAEPGQPLVPARTHLIDFGLTDVPGRTTRSTNVLRVTAALPTDDVPADDAGMDAPGQNAPTDDGVLGSIHFLSPEQAQGLPVDERGDLYQVAAVLYFALTGTVPYSRETSVEVLSAHVHAPPPVPSVGQAGIPRAVDRIVVKGMLKDRAARFATASSMLQAVQSARAVRVGLRTAPTPLLRDDRDARDARTRVLLAHRPQTAVGVPVSLGFAPATPSSAPQSTEAPPTRRRVLVASLATLGITGAIAIVWSLSLADPSAVPTALTSATPTAVATIAPEASPVPDPAASVDLAASQIALPDLTLMTLGDARAALENQGMVVGALNVENSVYAGDTVLGMTPSPGTLTDFGTPVQLLVASGSNVVPAVIGTSGADAIAALRDAGLSADLASEHAAATVVEVRPVAGTVLRLGATVDVVVAPAPPVAPTTPSTPVPTATPSAVPTVPAATPTPGPVLPTPTPTPSTGQ